MRISIKKIYNLKIKLSGQMAVMLESSPFSPTTLDNNPPYKYYIFSVKFICEEGGCAERQGNENRERKEKKK